ncbi:MAG: hypothetical protein ABWX70_12285, partial [Hyphomicrobium sp.]
FQGFGDGTLALHPAGLEPGLELLNDRILVGSNPGLGELNGVQFLSLGQFEALMQLLLELGVTHLLENVGIASLVDLEGLGAMRADDLAHFTILLATKVRDFCRPACHHRRSFG